MWVPLDNWQAASSFQEPVVPPADEPDAAPLVCVSFNAQWLPYVLASLMQLTQPAAWNASPSAVLTVLDQATRLVELFIEGVDCVSALEFRFTEGCVLQYSLDGGETWIDTPGWATFSSACFTGPTGPTGPTGATGATGATGNTPQLRWNGCTFQVSLDNGSTWSNLSGFSIPTLQGCLGGTPAVPPGTSPPQAACNIAGWLAVQILQGSLGSLASSIGSSATTLEAALGLFGLAAGWSGVGTLFFTAAGLFVAAGTAIGETALNAAASDSGLRANLICAIYDAILADGSVTPGNFSAVLANINAISYAVPTIVGLIHDYVSNLGYAGVAAIQAEGSLYAGDCSTCGTWCWEVDGTTASSMSPWALGPTLGQLGTFVAGQGVEGQATSGGVSNEADVFLHGLGTLHLTSVEVHFSAATADTHTQRWVEFYQHADFSGSTATVNLASTGAGEITETISAPAGDWNACWTRLSNDGGGNVLIIRQLWARGDGPNPFGTDNCV